MIKTIGSKKNKYFLFILNLQLSFDYKISSTSIVAFLQKITTLIIWYLWNIWYKNKGFPTLIYLSFRIDSNVRKSFKFIIVNIY